MSNLTLTGAGPEAAGSATFRAAVLADNPVGYWRFEETTGTVANDSSTSANAGTYTGGFTLNTVGALTTIPDLAVTLNGTTGYVVVPSAANLQVTSNFSFEMWVNPTTSTSNGQLIWKSSVGGGDDYSWGLSSGVPFFRIANLTINVSASTACAATTWTHLAVTYDGANVRFYKNGALELSPAGTGSASTSTGPLGIGAANPTPGTPSTFFTGALDEVAIYNSVLSAGRISAHFAAR